MNEDNYTWQGRPDWVTRATRKKGHLGNEIVVVEALFHDVTFADLEYLSETFGTKQINLDHDVREGGYCDTCRYSYTVTVITVMAITQWPGG